MAAPPTAGPPAADSAERPDPRLELLRFTTAGSVDDGKSTLIGRLLYETRCAFSDQVAEARRATSSASVLEAGEEIDFALLTDGLKAEREQGITIDVAYRYFNTPRRKFIIADTPGHEQYTRNMATGASTANLALVLIDARRGVLPQSKRHAFIASLLGIKHMVVCVNKLDLVGYSEEVFERIKREFADFAVRLEVPDLHFLPVSALRGDNVVTRSARMPWYKGAPLLEFLETLQFGSDRNLIDLRFPVQYVLRPDQDFRGYCGRVASGILRKGDQVMVLPSRKTTRISRIVTFDGDLERAFPPQSVTVCLEDELDVSRGDVLVHPRNQPHVARRLEAMVVWMSEVPLREGASYALKHTTQTVRARVEELRYRVDVNTLSREKAPGQLELNAIGRVVFSAHRPLLFDAYRRNRATGSLILVDPLTHETVGAGMIIQRQEAALLPGAAQDWHEERDEPDGLSRVGAADRQRLLGQTSATLWLTGLPACGGGEVAYALERALFERGHAAKVLSGRRLRATLSHDLDHSPADVSEHLRRVGAVARLLNEGGLIAICSFVSPTRAVRRQVRELVGVERLLEVHVASPLAWCEARDTHRVYERARAGELVNVAGVDAAYEPPEAPALVLRPDQTGFDEAAAAVVALLDERGILPARGIA